MKPTKTSLPNSLLIASITILTLNPSPVTLGLVLIIALHANATRLSRFKRQEQAAKATTSTESQEARLKQLEEEMKKLNSAVNMSKLSR